MKTGFVGFKFGVFGTKTRHWIWPVPGRTCVTVGLSPQDRMEMKIDVRKTCATIDVIGTLLSTLPDPTHYG